MEEALRKRILDSIRRSRLRIERALIVTESYQQSEGEPMIIRRAKALHDYANKIPIVIEDWQLVVGCFSAEPFAVSPFPESCWKTVLDNLDEFGIRPGDKYLVTEEDKQKLREVLPWWRGKSIQDCIFSILPREVQEAYEAGLIDTGYFTQGSGNFAADYSKVLYKGFAKIAEEIEDKMSQLDLTCPENLNKWFFYKAALICCDAVIDYAQRYAELAKKMAEEETRPERKKELLLIASNCERVPKYPATNFFEAVQAFWFIHLLLHFDAAGGAGIVAGRLDQLLAPFAEGVSKEEIRKWLKNLWINYNQIMYFLPGRTAYIWAGHPVSEQPTIAGVDERGEDASNELTELMLEIDKELRLPQPDIAVMFHKKIKRSVFIKACETLPFTMKPKFFNYDIMVKQALERGVRNSEDLKDLVDIGCVANGSQGKTWGNNGFTFLNLAKVLELALNNGVDPLTGKRLGPETGEPVNFKTFEEVFEAFKQQLAHVVRLTVVMMNVIEEVHTKMNPQPFASILIDDCLEKGIPVWEGGARYNIPGTEAVGLANVADSLAAIKKLVFDEHVIGMDQLIAALRANFEGEWERLRSNLIYDAPKFGNDDDYVDGIAVEVATLFCNELRKSKNKRGEYCPSLASVSAHVGLGRFVGALPDGRKAREPLADGMSPSQGECSKGPTAVIKSMTKIDHSLATGGTLLNMKFNAGMLTNPTSRDKFIHLLETYMELGGYHVQFNIIDTEKLRDAQLHPEKYPDLLVRVAAYVAQFGQLPKELQDDIIMRSELGEV